MAKALTIAAIVVGVAAVALTAGAALGLVPAVLGTIGGLTVTATGLAAVLGVAAAALNVAAGLLAPKPTFGGIGGIAGAGTQLDFTSDPTAGAPYVMGPARVGESVIHEASWGDKNRFLGIVGALSLGPIMAYDGLYVDNTLTTFSDGFYADGYYHNFLFLRYKLGDQPSATLQMNASDGSYMPDWDTASTLDTHRTSGIATAGLILTADVDNGKIFSGGVPQFTHQIRGVTGYDPRLDSTNGGSGSQLPTAEYTYAYSENPWVHHGTYAIGRWVNDVRVIGPGLPSASVDWASHIEAANIAEANGWTISGRVLSTDNKWQVLQSIAQAGGGYPIPTQAKLACLVNTPRVSLETIEEAHVKGAVTVPQMAMRRDRLNGAQARYREPDLGWQVMDGNVIRNSAYLTADGGTTKTKEIDLPLVADKDQAAQLVAYEVANSRERTPIQVPLDLYWAQYKTGDCLTLNLPSALLFNQKCVVIGREIDPESNTATFTFRTEDDAKHIWALGVDGGSLPSTTVGSSPGTGDQGTGISGTAAILRSSYPKDLRIDAVDAGTSVTATYHGSASGTATFIIDYATSTPQGITVPHGTITGLSYSTDVSTPRTYYAFCDVTGPLDASPAYGATEIYGDALNSAAHPNRIYLNQSFVAPVSGGTGTSGGATGGGYGGTSGGGAQGGWIP